MEHQFDGFQTILIALQVTCALAAIYYAPFMKFKKPLGRFHKISLKIILFVLGLATLAITFSPLGNPGLQDGNLYVCSYGRMETSDMQCGWVNAMEFLLTVGFLSIILAACLYLGLKATDHEKR